MYMSSGERSVNDYTDVELKKEKRNEAKLSQYDRENAVKS